MPDESRHRLVVAFRWGREQTLLRLLPGQPNPTDDQIAALADSLGVDVGTDSGAQVRVLEMGGWWPWPNQAERDPLDDYPAAPQPRRIA